MRDSEARHAAPGLTRGGQTPLWQQLLEDLGRRLEAGEFASSFPGELELVAEYQVSRHTVRRALRQLRSDGVVIAERGRRPRLAEAVEIAQPLGALYSLFASVEAAGLAQDSKVRALELRDDPVIAGRLGLRKGSRLLFLERLRLADGAPLALDQVWLPARIGRPLLNADFSHTALYEVLAARSGVRLTGGHEQIHAAVPGRDERALLGIRASVAVLVIDRLGFDAGRPVEWRHTVVRGDRFSLTAEFSVRNGYRVDVSGHTGGGNRPRPHRGARR